MYSICLICISFAILIGVGYKPIVIQSGSMSPALETGSLCLISEEKSYGYGDIVTFTTDGGIYVTHRIICENNDGTFVTKGDANKVEDSADLKKENIIGVVRVSVPILGYVVSFISTLLGKCIVCVVVFVLFLLSSILDSKIKTYNKVLNKEDDYEKQEIAE